MHNNDQKQAQAKKTQEENRRLRQELAKLGVDFDEHWGVTLHEENRRLREDLRWYVGLLKTVSKPQGGCEMPIVDKRRK